MFIHLPQPASKIGSPHHRMGSHHHRMGSHQYRMGSHHYRMGSDHYNVTGSHHGMIITAFQMAHLKRDVIFDHFDHDHNVTGSF